MNQSNLSYQPKTVCINATFTAKQAAPGRKNLKREGKGLGSPAGRLAAKPRRTKERRNQEFPVVVKKEEGRPSQPTLAPPNEREIEKLFVRKGGRRRRKRRKGGSMSDCDSIMWAHLPQKGLVMMEDVGTTNNLTISPTE